MKSIPARRTSCFLVPFLVLVFWISENPAVYAQTYTPKPGTKERTAILDPIRDPLEKALHRKVIFVVDHMKVEGDWAFVMASPRTRNGARIDYRGTKYEEDAETADEITIALLRKVGGKWTLLEHGYFTTDVWWEGLWKSHKSCPRSIFP